MCAGKALIISVAFYFSLLFNNSLYGQLIPKEPTDIGFIQHLISRGYLEEAIFLLEDSGKSSNQSNDTINYLLGMVYYSLKDLEVSSQYLLKITPESQWYNKSIFFASYNSSFLGKPQNAIKILEGASLNSSHQVDAMLNFQKAGISLLNRNLDEYLTYSAGFTGQYGFNQLEEIKFREYHNTILSYRKKSPVLAATLSTVVPGLGKIYAGKTGEGLSSLLYVGAFSAIAYDFYAKSGFRNPFFIISATLATFFYAGNIMGSYAAANRTNNQFNYEIDQKILFDMHIPLRRLFP